MANEAILVFRTAMPIPFTCDNGTGIEKGALLKLTDPMTASSANGTNDFVCGVAASEKVASDGKTKLGIYRNGIFRFYLSGSCVAGDSVGSIADSVNFVAKNSDTTLSGCRVVGNALEDGATGEQILVELNPTSKGV